VHTSLQNVNGRRKSRKRGNEMRRGWGGGGLGSLNQVVKVSGIMTPSSEASFTHNRFWAAPVRTIAAGFDGSRRQTGVHTRLQEVRRKSRRGGGR